MDGLLVAAVQLVQSFREALDEGEHEFFVTGGIRGRFAHGVKLRASELRTNSSARLAWGTPVGAARCYKTRPPPFKTQGKRSAAATVAVGSCLYFNRGNVATGRKVPDLRCIRSDAKATGLRRLRATLHAVGYAPIEERRASATDWLNRCTSAWCSASTITLARGSVPE